MVEVAASRGYALAVTRPGKVAPTRKRALRARRRTLPKKRPQGAFGKVDAIYQDLEEVAARLGFSVILDTGPFKGGACILDGDEMIVLNSSAPLEQRMQHLAEALGRRDLSRIYLKPAIRLILDQYQGFGAP